MKRTIKSEENIGIAKQVHGYVVDVEQHPTIKNCWRFELFGQTWIASDYAFKEEKSI